MKTIIFFFYISISISCQRAYIDRQRALEPAPDYPAAQFVVASDFHFYDQALGITGAAFDDYLLHDRKLLVESAEILETAIHSIVKASPDFVLIPGDMTKDGEKINHERVAALLQLLEQHDISVYVIPGNHDINNYEACRYDGDSIERIESVTPDLFRDIYKDFGFDEAIAIDSNSSSYVVEPIPGLWVFGLDACEYEDHQTGKPSKIGGRLKKSTLQWMVRMLESANQKQKAVIGFMHHGVLEHFEYQAEYFADYVVRDGRAISRILAENNMKVIFTGHFHAQDIVVAHFANDRVIFDVETGSIVTYPCPWRMVRISPDQKMTIKTHYIESIPSRSEDFAEYSLRFLRSGLRSSFLYRTRPIPMFAGEAAKTADDFSNLLMAHYRGDETREQHMRARGCASCCLLGMTSEVIEGLKIDPEPPDNNTTIDLRSGEFYSF